MERARHEWKYLTCGVEGAEREVSLRKRMIMRVIAPEYAGLKEFIRDIRGN
jgi:hypothetical protein